MLIGHQNAVSTWQSAMDGGKLHHAWLLAGPSGVGKATFAWKCAAQLVGADGPESPVAENHPDILELSRPPADDKEARNRDEGKPYKRKRNISVDQIRGLQRRLNTRPTLGACRAIIVDPADDLEASAANALLKSLEEPPAGNVFFLVTHRPGRLLPTIRSRCRTLRFEPLAEDQVRGIVASERPEADPGAIDRAVAGAFGSPGAAMTWLDEDMGKLDAAMRALIAEGDNGMERRGALAAAIGARPTPERIAAIFTLGRRLLTSRLRSAPPLQRQRIIDAHADLVSLAARAPTANFDPGLLAMEIGGLLASAALPREAA
ncbi:DNA polymerase III subunit delta' [Pseudoblastomonas halimionae]|uniref:DNA polymerase III subunit delta n=1 Tax=Alteriqipengyuania halimionae TaxID=1926630 RepID=A0A6I4U0T0_9SPHN|nr:DNA polymerase III subunit delta' [Alteriqipengyuania halimionae]MXP09488.1 DNA polymerase III subunit delta' [Alteriqipengyuania halimionae]